MEKTEAEKKAERMARARIDAERFVNLYKRYPDVNGQSIEHLAIMLDTAWLDGWNAAFDENHIIR